MATVKIAYTASAALTYTSLASLASDTNLLAGASSLAVDNTTNLFVDALLSGVIEVGTSPTAGNIIDVWLYANLASTPTYPDTIAGTDATKTLTSANVRNTALVLALSITVDSTTNRLYPFSPFSVAQQFNGVLPQHWGVFVVQNTGVALAASGSSMQYVGIAYTVV